MNILGLNAFHADSSVCLFVNGEMRAAVEEERFRRIKHWAGFPSIAIDYCLKSQNLRLSDIDVIAINTDPNAARLKKAQYLLSGKASLALVKEKMRVRENRHGIREHLHSAFPNAAFNGKIEYVEHHKAHLASAYLVSPFSKASVISVDGFGDFASSAWGFGDGEAIELQHRVFFPHSLGIFYQSLTQYLGFLHYGDEYKVMGLAPYGKPAYQQQMDQIVSAKENGSFKLNLDYFQHHRQPMGYQWDNGSPKFSQLYDKRITELLGPPRQPDEPLSQHHFDIARSIQDAYERTLFSMLNVLHKQHQSDNLCIAGGCGMNSVANGKIHLKTPYKNLYVQSAAGDAGGAIGAALIANQRHQKTTRFSMQHSYWGPEFSNLQLEKSIAENQTLFSNADCTILLNQDIADLCGSVSNKLINGNVVGWFQGAMEWGPRALGNRSILGDPRRSDMKDILNLKIKRRESFRPFAPSVLREAVGDWFESVADVPFMMKVFQIKPNKRNQIPAVTHVDGSGRLQTVTEQSNPVYYQLIRTFCDKTGVPMLLNTSFNENEPVVCTPQEAIDCFLRTQMDVLVLGSHIVMRASVESTADI